MKRYVEHEPQWKRVTTNQGRGDSICIHERETGHGDCNVSMNFETHGAYSTRNPHSCLLYTICPFTFSHTRHWCGNQGCRDQ